MRAHGERLGLARVAHKLESQDLCFVPDGDYAGFVAREAGSRARPGPMRRPRGRGGRHARGLARYTVGQRKGLGIAAAEPRYVIGLEPSTNAVRVGPESALFAREASFTGFNWLPASRSGRGRAHRGADPLPPSPGGGDALRRRPDASSSTSRSARSRPGRARSSTAATASWAAPASRVSESVPAAS